MNSLTQKLAFSYGLLIIIIIAVSGWGIYHIVHLGRAVDVILINNYKSIVAAENMKEALEREDSAAMFFIAGHGERARRQFHENAQKFAAEFQIASNNVTEPGESQIVSDIDRGYAAYKQSLDAFLNQKPERPIVEMSNTYFNQLEPAFLALKVRLDNLLHLNQEAMVRASDRAIAVSRRAEFSTGATAAIALILALVFAWQFTRYVVRPISLLAQKVKRVGEGDLDQHIEVSSKDEIGVLAAEFNRMLVRLRDLRKSDYGRVLIEQKKSDAVIDSIAEPVLVTDSSDRVIKVNRAARDLFGGSLVPRGGAGLEGLEGGESIARAVHDALSMQRHIAPDGETAMVPIRLDGTQRSFRVRATPMRDSEGRLLGAVILLEDITTIAEVDRLKTEFISVASSKLREPLRSLELALHAVIEGAAGELNPQQKSLLEDARENAAQLDELMCDLLELAEIESGALRLATQRLRPIDLAREAVEEFKFAAESRHIKLENNVWPDLSWVIADRKAVSRIFNNLLSNALRYTERNGRVTIEAREGVGRILFSVHDTGPGIPAEYLPKIFSRFVQIPGRPGGSGLGLALVKRLVEAQSGQVSVESREGEGSSFTFSLLVGGPSSVGSSLRTRSG